MSRTVYHDNPERRPERPGVIVWLLFCAVVYGLAFVVLWEVTR